MSFITYMVNKKTGKKYAYRQENVWDPEKGQSRAKRTYLGRVDPETGEIIPKRGSKIVVDTDETTEDKTGQMTMDMTDETAKDNTGEMVKDMADETVVDQTGVSDLEEENARLKARIAELEVALAKLATGAIAAIKGEGE